MRPLLERIVDDAALFPPARKPMEPALAAYREAAGHPVVGRFLCPASRIAELRRLLIPEDLLDLGLVADTALEDLPAALEAARREPRVRLRSVRVGLAPGADQARAAAVAVARLPADLPCLIVRIRQTPGWREALDRLAAARGSGARLAAEFRVGGPWGDDVPGGGEADGEYAPSPAQVAAFMTACAERGLPFTCMAGEYHTVRRVDPATGAARHGFLNLLVAACRARSDPSDPTAVAEAVASADRAALAAEAAGADGRAVRRLFVAFGCCDIDTPRAELIKFGPVGEDTVA